mgnify:CR=1 FL=1
MHAQTMKIRQSREDRAFTAVIAVVVGLIMLLTIYPLYIVVISSFSAPMEVISGHVWLLPQGFSGEGYRRVFQNSDIFMSYKNTIIYTVLGTAVSLFFTLSAAYPLSRKKLYGRTGLMLLFTFTMFFKGGMIPTYLTVKGLGLYNNIWVMVLMGSLSIYNMIVARTNIQNSIPEELLEASTLDGCNDTQYFFYVVLPLSKAILAVLGIWYAVGHWNSYFNAFLYLTDKNLYPLQIFLRQILLQNNFDADLMDEDMLAQIQNLQEVLKYAIIVISTAPLMLIYPFVQKYFVKGVMIGSVKG